MKDKGFFGIGCIGMKFQDNYGTLLRTAQILGADFIYIVGKRFEKLPQDTMHSHKHIPTVFFDTEEDFLKHLPHGCKLVSIELTDNSVLLENFKHPKRAIYMLGAEDYGLSENILSKSNHIVKLPGKRSMNVSVAGSIVLYDRITKVK